MIVIVVRPGFHYSGDLGYVLFEPGRRSVLVPVYLQTNLGNWVVRDPDEL